MRNVQDSVCLNTGSYWVMDTNFSNTLLSSGLWCVLTKMPPGSECSGNGCKQTTALMDLASFALAPRASRRRQDLLDLFDQLTPKIQELTQSLEEEVEKRPVARRLRTHPGVGPLTALAFELVIRNARTVTLRQADCQLCRPGSVGRIQRRSAPTGTHQQAGQRAVTITPIKQVPTPQLGRKLTSA